MTLCVALAALVFATRAWLIRTAGSAVPWMDQWADAELFRRWLTGALRWDDLIAAHNEHRIALTRIANLALFTAGGSWNPWAQLLLNAALHALTAAALFWLFAPVLNRRTTAALAGGLALLFAATAGWQNALWGFQSQVYFGNVLAVAGLALTGTSPPLQRRWWLGAVALALALFSNAGGLLASLAALPLAWSRADDLCRRCVAIATLAAIAAAGFALQVHPPQHAALHAQNAGQFAAVLARCLSWPHVDSAWLWLGVQLPLPLLAWLRWRSREPWSAAERCAAALVLLSVLQAAAVAYSRGAGLPELRPLSRYQDPLILGVAAQLFLLLRLVALPGRALRLLALAWPALVLGGLLQLTAMNLSLHLPFKRAQDAASLEQIRTYLKTGDAAALVAQPPFTGAHPDPGTIQRVLDDPTLQPVLPAVFHREAPAPWPIRHAPESTAGALLGYCVALALLWRAGSCPRPPCANRHRDRSGTGKVQSGTV